MSPLFDNYFEFSLPASLMASLIVAFCRKIGRRQRFMIAFASRAQRRLSLCR